MFTPGQYRAKADEYQQLAKQTAVANEIHEFKELERSFTTLADNEEWLQRNLNKTVQRAAADRPADAALVINADAQASDMNQTNGEQP